MSFAKGLAGKNTPAVSVEKTDAEVQENGTVKKGHVSFVLKVSAAYDASIPETVEELREAVVKEVVRITDFQVDRVDIIVAQLEGAEQLPIAAEEMAEEEQGRENGH